MTSDFLNLYYCLAIAVANVFAINKTEVYTIFTEGCTIPGLPLVSEQIKNLVGPPKTNNNCADNARLVTSNSSHIWVIKEAFPQFNIWIDSDFFCCYRYFSPVDGSNVVYGDCKEFSSIILAEHEYVRTECYYLDDKIYDDFLIFPSKKIINATYNNAPSYNVLILGLENMSRLNFHRTMPKTSNFLTSKGLQQLFGYNKVGDNSFPNLFPAFSGRSFKDFQKTYVNSGSRGIDMRTFIWNNFKRAGYDTALGSDSPTGLFGIYESNFSTIPTDFYLQPLFSEARALYRNKNYGYHQCLGSKFSYKILLDYIYEVTTLLTSRKLFGIFWEESVSHQEDINNPHIMDESYYHFLNYLEQDNYLNKTILIILSDHGMRWGNIVQTAQGRIEERLPMLGILFPHEFQTHYKLAFDNFVRNCRRLTTPFDIYKTLSDLVDLNALTDDKIKERCGIEDSINNNLSLFLPVSQNRTCKSLRIDDHWCTCYKGERLKVGNKRSIIAAKYLLRHINNLLVGFPQCHKLKIRHILYSSLVKNNKREKIYSITVKTTPGSAIYDGTLVRDLRTWVVSGTVSRLNLYQNQSYCVNDYLIKMYCFCG